MSGTLQFRLAVHIIQSILIIAFSLGLFVYWFRYTVLLLLSEDNVREHKPMAGHLSLVETCEALRETHADAALNRLERALDKDYRMLRYLLGHAAGLGLRPIEHFLLMLDYRLLRMWYRVTRYASTTLARGALQEMASILTYIAYKMGERSQSPAGI
jgi:hypothetical protein